MSFCVVKSLNYDIVYTPFILIIVLLENECMFEFGLVVFISGLLLMGCEL